MESYNPIEIPIHKLKNICGVYQIRNKKNNKVYIGSSNNLAKRCQVHFRELSSGKHINTYLQHAYNKDKEFFCFEIITTCNESEQFDKEQYWINKFFGNNCYNINPVASKPPVLKGDNHPNKKRVYTKEMREKLSEAAKKRFMEHPEQCKQLSLSKLGKHTGYDHPNSKPVICLETNVVYACAGEVQRVLGISEKGIRACCLGSINSYKGLHWVYLEYYNKLTEEDIQQIISRPNRKKVRVIRVEDETIFNSVLEASTITGIDRRTIQISCQTKRTSAGGYHWLYYDEVNPEEIARVKGLRILTTHPVVCKETGKCYPSIAEAAKDTNSSASKISLCCSHKRKSTNGLHWAYLEELKLNKLDKITI